MRAGVCGSRCMVGAGVMWEQVCVGAGVMWEQVCVGAGVMWKQVCVGAGVVWVQCGVGAGVCGSRCVWEQVCVGAGVVWEQCGVGAGVWEQVCVGAGVVWEQVCVGAGVCVGAVASVVMSVHTLYFVQMFAETTTSLSVDSSRGNTPSDDHSDRSVESQKDKLSPSNRPHSSSMYVRGSNDTARNVTRSGSVPSPSPPENRQKPSSSRPKVPAYPHPQRPPPPPPDGKGTSFVRLQSAKFEGTNPTGPPKPKIPPGKPTLCKLTSVVTVLSCWRYDK